MGNIVDILKRIRWEHYLKGFEMSYLGSHTMTNNNTVENWKVLPPWCKWWCAKDACKEYWIPAVNIRRLQRCERHGGMHWVILHKEKGIPKWLVWSWHSVINVNIWKWQITYIYLKPGTCGELWGRQTRKRSGHRSLECNSRVFELGSVRHQGCLVVVVSI